MIGHWGMFLGVGGVGDCESGLWNGMFCVNAAFVDLCVCKCVGQIPCSLVKVSVLFG